MESTGNFPRRRKSFVEAIREKYGVGDDVIDNLIIDIRFSNRNFTRNTSAEFDFLRNVVLNNQNVGFAGVSPGELITLCPNVVDLDLSRNVIELWLEILPMLSQLPNLKFVNLSNNKFSQNKENQDYLTSWKTEMKLENLVLNGTGIPWDNVLVLCRTLPGLSELHLGSNDYSSLNDDDLDPICKLRDLHLHDNLIHEWSEIWKLRVLPNLQTLILSGNPITDIFYRKSRERNEKEHEELVDTRRDNDIVVFLLEEIIEDVVSGVNCNKYKNRSDEVRCSGDAHKDAAMVCEDSCHNAGGDEANYGCQSNRDFNQDHDLNDNVEVFCKSSSLRFWVSLDSCEGYNSGKLQNKTKRKKYRRDTSYKNTDVRFKNAISRNKSNNQNSDFRNERQDSNLNSERSRENEWKNTSTNNEACTENSSSRIKSSFVPFHCLKHLCISNTGLSTWEQLITMRHFPSLCFLKIMGIPLEKDTDCEERRKLFTACLPTISVLNGSEITAADRELSERHFLRYFADKMPQPSIIPELENKHGKLEPLLDIDLRHGFREWVNLKFIYSGDLVKRANVHVTKPVAVLRKFIAHRLADQYGINAFRMWHNPCGEYHDETSGELTELFLDSLPMSRFDIMDGDEIHVEGI